MQIVLNFDRKKNMEDVLRYIKISYVWISSEFILVILKKEVNNSIKRAISSLR